MKPRLLDKLRRKYIFEPKRIELEGQVYVTIPLPALGDAVTTMILGIERQFIYRPPFLLSIDADYKMRQFQPRILIGEGWRFVY